MKGDVEFFTTNIRMSHRFALGGLRELGADQVSARFAPKVAIRPPLGGSSKADARWVVVRPGWLSLVDRRDPIL
jgi:hypothetical protein